jgi:hypothetical protein
MEKGSALLNNVNSSVTDIRGRLDVALDSVTKTVNHVDGLIDVVQPDIKKMAANAAQITGTVNEIASDLNAGKGPAGLLLKDEATRQQCFQARRPDCRGSPVPRPGGEGSGHYRKCADALAAGEGFAQPRSRPG